MQGISFFRSLKTDNSSCICIQNGRVGECFVERNCRFQQIFDLERFSVYIQAVCHDRFINRNRTGMQKLHHFYIFCCL